MMRTLATLERADADQIRRYQERKLRALVQVAARRSPFYRDWFRTADVRPRDIQSLDDLTRLPLLSRRDLADRVDDFLVYPRRLMWPARSSGTSGSVVTAYRTPGSSVYELAFLERQWRWFGLPSDARRVILRGSSFASDQHGKPTKPLPGANQLFVSSYQLTPDNIRPIAEEIRAFEPHAVEGWPSSITLLATLLRECDLRMPVRAIITSSEVMSPGQLRLMREVFGGPIVDHYGQTERVAMAGGCEQGGYHVFPDYGIVELLPVPGVRDRWEIVGTPLHNWGFPLFRYRTGDEIGPAGAGPCPCGRAFERIGAIDGRVEDSFVAADGRPLPLPSTILDDLTGLRMAQIAQLSKGRFEVRVVPGVRYDADRTTQQVLRNVDRYFGKGQEVSVRTLSTLPDPASGKFRCVVVEGR
ncbi:phenylacetate--CoA ligase family protein [Nakamurella sp. GG22]